MKVVLKLRAHGAVHLSEYTDMINELRKMIKTFQTTVDAANKRKANLVQERDNLKKKQTFSAKSCLDLPVKNAPLIFRGS